MWAVRSYNYTQVKALIVFVPSFSCSFSNMLQDKSVQFCLSAGIVSLLVGGTFAAKSVFLVDNEMEAKTEFASKNWYLDGNSIQKYPNDIEKLAFNYIDRIAKLPENKAWCGIDREISLVLAKAQSLNLLKVNNFDRGSADIVISLPESKPAIVNMRLYVDRTKSPAPKQANANGAETWCIANGMSK
jgi:hypothetical protein